MTSQRKIAADAVFMVMYIGIVGAMACLTLTLAVTYLIGLDLNLPHQQMAALNLAGWIMLPLAQKAYQPLTGTPFAWRSNSILDGGTEL